MAEVVVHGHFRERELLWEPVKGLCVSDSCGGRDISFGADIVIYEEADVPSFYAMGTPSGALVWGFMYNYFGDW